MANRVFYTKVGSRKSITAQLKDGTGALNLTGASVVCRARAPEDNNLILNGSATLTDAANGKVSYTPTSGEASAFVKGQYALEWVVTLSGITFMVPDDGHDVLQIEEALT